MSMEQIVSGLIDDLESEIACGRIQCAEDADRRAAALVSGQDWDLESEEYERAMSALCEVAARHFPGDW